MILNSKYLNIRELTIKKLEEFLISLDQMVDQEEEKELETEKNQIFISTSQILTKILLGNL